MFNYQNEFEENPSVECFVKRPFLDSSNFKALNEIESVSNQFSFILEYIFKYELLACMTKMHFSGITNSPGLDVKENHTS